VEPAFKLTTVVKKPAATSLYSVDPLDPNHDATMRIEGEAPKQQQPILFPGAKNHGGTAGCRYLGSFFGRFYARRGAKTLYLFFPPVADYAAECSLKPSGMTPSFA
jgi:hypothetical protein